MMSSLPLSAVYMLISNKMTLQERNSEIYMKLVSLNSKLDKLKNQSTETQDAVNKLKVLFATNYKLSTEQKVHGTKLSMVNLLTLLTRQPFDILSTITSSSQQRRTQFYTWRFRCVTWARCNLHN